MKQRLLISLVLMVAIAFGVAQENAVGDTALPARHTMTDTYHLFPVFGSSVQGAMHVAGRYEGGSRLVVTIIGITAGRLYLPVLYAGDCGPDGERVMELTAVGSRTNDPFASITELTMPFEAIDTEDYFLYIFSASDPTKPLACGEVGLGANREG